jgi:hypothetical protein
LKTKWKDKQSLTETSIAVTGIPGYMSKGLATEIRKRTLHTDHSIDAHLRSARIKQGEEHFQQSSPSQREAIIGKWKEIQPKLPPNREHRHGSRHRSKYRSTVDLETEGSQTSTATTSTIDVTDLSLDTDLILEPDLSLDTDDTSSPLEKQITTHHELLEPLTRTNTVVLHRHTDEEIEAAIQSALQKTSTGNIYKDRAVETALRRSFKEIGKKKGDGDNEEEVWKKLLEANLGIAPGSRLKVKVQNLASD